MQPLLLEKPIRNTAVLDRRVKKALSLPDFAVEARALQRFIMKVTTAQVLYM